MRALIPLAASTAATLLVHAAAPAAPRLFFLDVRAGRVVSANTDGTDVKTLVTGLRGTPDGIVIDPEAGYIYWTHMGVASANDGYIQRARLDGSAVTKIVADGGTFTPKQLKLDATHGKLYWSDREGMRIMRADVDGSHIETLIETGSDRGQTGVRPQVADVDRANQANWCVGIALDVDRGKVYWTQKGGNPANAGSIRRANLEVPPGMTPSHRPDVEVLVDGLPEPIDLDVDPRTRMMYWTDRGDPPRGNTVSRAPMDPPRGANPSARTDLQVLFGGLKEGIGIALDPTGGRLYVTDLGGNVYSANLDGSDRRTIMTGQGSLTGIAFAPAVVTTSGSLLKK
jgi:DNA-binding beta-propeller fold protein YncE